MHIRNLALICALTLGGFSGCDHAFDIDPSKRTEDLSRLAAEAPSKYTSCSSSYSTTCPAGYSASFSAYDLGEANCPDGSASVCVYGGTTTNVGTGQGWESGTAVKQNGCLALSYTPGGRFCSETCLDGGSASDCALCTVGSFGSANGPCYHDGKYEGGSCGYPTNGVCPQS